MDNNIEYKMLDKQKLWDKAGSKEHITRTDVGVRPPENNQGIQSFREGFFSNNGDHIKLF